MKPLLPLLLFVLSAWLPAQGIGLHPPEVNWQQLRADHVRVIFPQGYEERARRVATLIDRMAEEHTRSVGEQLYDFDLILQTPNMTVNGYVGLGPFRSEFYVTPPQTFSRLSNTDWVDLLSIHEFRHVQQTSNERRGLTRLASLIQGQLGWAALSGIATPNWFAEGDAVVAETALTPSGRGRTPAFSKDLRALLANNVVYRYAKARNGSFRDLVPDHYRYGYAMTTYARERFGNDVWKPVLQEGAAFRGLLYPFSRALKRETGLSTRDLYFRTMADLEQLQDSSLARRRPLVEGSPLSTAPTNDIRSYSFPFRDREGRLLALRSSYRELPALVEVGEAGDRVITRTGIQREPWLAGSPRFAMWTQYGQDPRYTNQNYSDLVLYELATGRVRQLSERGHYVSATFSPDERRIAAVWYDPLDDSPELHLLDVATGQLLQRRAVSETNLAWPAFSADGQTVYFLGQNHDGVAIEAWDLATDGVRTLRPRSAEPIDMLRTSDVGDLIFTGGRSGVDNIYRLSPDGESDEALTDVAIGAYYPYLVEGQLYYSSPTPRGDRLYVLSLSDLHIKGLPELDSGPSYFQRPAAYAAEAKNLTKAVVADSFPIRNFSNTFGGIRLHSWSFNGNYVTPGLALEAANALKTVAIVADVSYNINEARYAGGLSVEYGGFFPVLSLEARYRERNTIAQIADIDSISFVNQEFGQISVGPTATVPLEWVSGNTATAFAPYAGLQYYALSGRSGEMLPSGFMNLSLGLRFSSLRRTAFRQVQPRLGLTAAVAYDRAIGSNSSGERLLLRTSAYLPGLWLTHGIRLDLDAQTEQLENAYQYPDAFRYARGYTASLNDRVFRLGFNYQLPLLYPDLGILGITYFKRIRLNAFADYSRFTIDQPRELSFNERSVGGQLFFDNVWLNAQLITVGVEAAYRLDRDVFSSDPQDLQFRMLLSGSF